MSEMSTIVNKLLNDISDRVATRTGKIEDMMSEVDGLYVANVDTFKQLQRAKQLTQQLYTEIGSN
jgi:hypothetical protein